MVFNREIANYEAKVRTNPENEDRYNLYLAISLERDIDDVISLSRNLTDMDDEEIFDEILSYAGSEISEYERELLAERLGIN